jgi:methylated-DNA-[protein]-cysteine S-methyltransferase
MPTTLIGIGYYDSPIGAIEIGATAEAIATLYFVDQRSRIAVATALTEAAIEQLAQYFAGERQSFDLPTSPQGTPFQRMVWGRLLGIPFGQTASYKGIAVAIGRPRAARAVGGAVGHNPISIIVPCHRVIGIAGGLRGYSGGLWRKAWLLQHEGVTLL